MIRLLESDADGVLRLICADDRNPPPFAILSHTWGLPKEEVTFKNVTKDEIVKDDYRDKAGYRKLRFCSQQAQKASLRYFWADTCCIDKDISTELNEALVSMFRWYQTATECYVYLSDVSTGPLSPAPSFRLVGSQYEPEFRKSRWFRRGWTLQELLAPSIVKFFSLEGHYIGDKYSLSQLISEITGLPVSALRGAPLDKFTVEERLNHWTKFRETTREEDQAYCLFGILGVSMPVIYGEGEKCAWSRLAAEIERQSSPKASQETFSHGISSPQVTSLARKSMSDRPGPSKKPRLATKLPLEDHWVRSLSKTLSFDQIGARYDSIETAYMKTCGWILTDPQYVEWLELGNYDRHSGFLWIKGKAGSGKSTIMKFILDNASNKKKKRKNNILLSFFFNARGTDLERSTVGMYRAILSQLLSHVTSSHFISSSLKARLQETNATPKLEWDAPSLQRILAKVFDSLERKSIICFIDALDECDENEVRDMISFFEDICQRNVSYSTHGHIQICLASRYYPHISLSKGLELKLDEKEGHKQDLHSYIARKLKLGTDKYAQDIQAEMLSKASGIFIWVVLVVRILNEEFDKGGKHQLRRKLTEIPSDIYKLFLDILTRDSDDREKMKLCIQWILFTKQPLTAKELYWAVYSGLTEPDSLDVGAIKIDHEDALKFVLHNTKGLAEIVKSGPRFFVQFIHESVRDFFLKEGGFCKIWQDSVERIKGQSHETLKLCCVRYLESFYSRYSRLLSDVPSQNYFDHWSKWGTIHKRFPFLRYTVYQTHYHADDAAASDIQQAEFLQNFEVSRWVKLMCLFRRESELFDAQNTSLLYFLAMKGLVHLMSHHSDTTSYLKEEQGSLGTPLVAALAYGNKEVILAFMQAQIKGQKLPEKFSRLLQEYSMSPPMSNTDRWRFRHRFYNNPRLINVMPGFDSNLLNFILGVEVDTTMTENKPLWDVITAADRSGHSEAVFGMICQSYMKTNRKIRPGFMREVSPYQVYGFIFFIIRHGFDELNLSFPDKIISLGTRDEHSATWLQSISSRQMELWSLVNILQTAGIILNVKVGDDAVLYYDHTSPIASPIASPITSPFESPAESLADSSADSSAESADESSAESSAESADESSLESPVESPTG